MHIFLLAVILIVLVTVFLEAIPFAWPFGQVVAEILSGILGFGLLYLFIRYRQDFKARRVFLKSGISAIPQALSFSAASFPREGAFTEQRGR